MLVRPKTFAEFNGQRDVVYNLEIAVRSAARQRQVMGHILFAGPAGLGKTTLATTVLPNEIGCDIRSINCAAVERPTDLTRVLSLVGEGDILFLDEIHALLPSAREHLLTAMEDHTISVRVGEGDQMDVVTIPLPEFTIIGATTRQGLLDGPLRTRFRHIFTLTPYDDESLSRIIWWHADARAAVVDPGSTPLLLGPAHGVARRAVNLLEACIDTYFGSEAEPQHAQAVITGDIISTTLRRLGYCGVFDENEFRYLTLLKEVGTEMGLKSISAAMDETPATVEEVIEPWLIRQGYVLRKSNGRVITERGAEILCCSGG